MDGCPWPLRCVQHPHWTATEPAWVRRIHQICPACLSSGFLGKDVPIYVRQKAVATPACCRINSGTYRILRSGMSSVCLSRTYSLSFICIRLLLAKAPYTHNYILRESSSSTAPFRRCCTRYAGFVPLCGQSGQPSSMNSPDLTWSLV